MTEIEAPRVAAVHAAELERFAREHPRSRVRFERARASLVGGVPMTWMAKWVGGHPVYAASAHGAPFHNMALVSPATTEADVDRHTAVFAEAVAALV